MCLAKLIDCFGIKNASIPEAVCLFLDFLGVEVGDQFLEFQDSRLRLKILLAKVNGHFFAKIKEPSPDLFFG